MSNSDIEKGAGASTYVQQPQAAHVEHSTSFLPTYEEHLNENLRKFGQPDGQDNAKAFDLIEEPKAGRRKCMKREYLILAIVFFLICAIALPLGLVFIIRNHHSDQEPPTLQTRQAETTSSNITPVTAVLTSTVVPVTVYVTVTPEPEAWTPSVTVTRTQSQSTSTSETTTSDASTATVTALSIVTATPSTSTSTSTSTTSTLSKFSLDPALVPSIQSELAEASSSHAAEETKATATPRATTNTETTTATVVSATTIEPPTTASKAMQTAHPRFGFCGVAGSNC